MAVWPSNQLHSTLTATITKTNNISKLKWVISFGSFQERSPHISNVFLLKGECRMTLSPSFAFVNKYLSYHLRTWNFVSKSIPHKQSNLYLFILCGFKSSLTHKRYESLLIAETPGIPNFQTNNHENIQTLDWKTSNKHKHVCLHKILQSKHVLYVFFQIKTKYNVFVLICT